MTKSDCDVQAEAFEPKSDIIMKANCFRRIDGNKGSKHAKSISNLAIAKSETRSPFQVILTAEQARSVYCLRSTVTVEGSDGLFVAGKSSLVAEMFGVSPKTIRDVWNRKTWSQVNN